MQNLFKIFKKTKYTMYSKKYRNVCPKLSKGTPNSVKINTNEKFKYLKIKKNLM